jgi:hypothetical protein
MSTGFEMRNRTGSAKDFLKAQRLQTKPAWSRLLIRPLWLRDGTVLLTLKDAAEKVLELPAAPSSRVAAKRIIEAATEDGDMASTHAVLRLALRKSLRSKP